MNRALFSSATEDWATPQDLFDSLNRTFQFDLDVCATLENRKCTDYFDKDQDGLSQDWSGRRCWMNPPYGRQIGKWMEKAFTENHKNGTLVCCLVPARTDTKWWHDYATKGTIRFIHGRLKFGNSQNSAPFPSAIILFW